LPRDHTSRFDLLTSPCYVGFACQNRKDRAVRNLSREHQTFARENTHIDRCRCVWGIGQTDAVELEKRALADRLPGEQSANGRYAIAKRCELSLWSEAHLIEPCGSAEANAWTQAVRVNASDRCDFHREDRRMAHHCRDDADADWDALRSAQHHTGR